ncbi:MAG: RNA-binding protein [Bacteroidetes bacterium RIFOXYA12_FULL_35_11]|nr:MAG: RNA-binding protein [Bacteroidetes bacterium GWF2_35_48]OFY75787.1 MAG: RNA-binding protein [Bacteroidetes bacterium RIFOXYA12_FULL_35_11]
MTIYIGNVSYKLREDDLQAAFAEFGTISSVKIIKDKVTKKSKGYGFIEMDNEEEAERAIEAMNGKEFQGRALKVHKAHPRKEEE